MTRRELQQEQRRINALRKRGFDDNFIKSWLRGWRKVANKRTY